MNRRFGRHFDLELLEERLTAKQQLDYNSLVFPAIPKGEMELIWLGHPLGAIDKILELSPRQSFRHSCILPCYIALQTLAHRQVFYFDSLLSRVVCPPDGQHFDLVFSSTCPAALRGNRSIKISLSSNASYFIRDSTQLPVAGDMETMTEQFANDQVHPIDAARGFCLQFLAGNEVEELESLSALLLKLGFEDTFTLFCQMYSLIGLEKVSQARAFFDRIVAEGAYLSSPAEEYYLMSSGTMHEDEWRKLLDQRARKIFRTRFFTNRRWRKLLWRILSWNDLKLKSEPIADIVVEDPGRG